MLHELLKEIYKFEDNQVKPHHATGTRWIAQKLEITYKMLDKYGLYMQHFKHIIVDTSKQTDKVKLQGKCRQLTNGWHLNFQHFVLWSTWPWKNFKFKNLKRRCEQIQKLCDVFLFYFFLVFMKKLIILVYLSENPWNFEGC